MKALGSLLWYTNIFWPSVTLPTHHVIKTDLLLLSKKDKVSSSKKPTELFGR